MLHRPAGRHDIFPRPQDIGSSVYRSPKGRNRSMESYHPYRSSHVSHLNYSNVELPNSNLASASKTRLEPDQVENEQLLQKVALLEQEFDRFLHRGPELMSQGEDFTYGVHYKLDEPDKNYLRYQLIEKETQLKQLEAERVTSYTAQAHLEEVLANTKTQLDELVVTHASCEKQKQEKDQQIQILTQKLSKAEEELSKANQQKHSLKSKFKQVSAQNKELTKASEKLQEKQKAVVESQSGGASVYDQLKFLKETNENLMLELQSRPTHKQYRDSLQRIRDLESSHPSVPKDMHRSTTTDSVTQELAQLLSVTQPSEILSKAKSAIALATKLVHLVSECSSESDPSYRQVWKWVRHLTEDLHDCKKKFSALNEQVQTLTAMFDAQNLDVLKSKVSLLLSNSQTSSKIPSE